jgi:mxaJ protein
MTAHVCAVVLTAAVLSACGSPITPAATRVIRICADPNNLPFSNRAGEGFENKIAELLAADRGASLEYTWWAQRRGFLRNTLNGGLCDLVVGVPSALEAARVTAPYYRSSYVFASRRDRQLGLSSLDDARLPRLRIGVQLIGDDSSNSPPAHALARRGIVRNVVGYSVYGDYAQASPLSAIMAAVERGDVDAALVWGPAAGYFARRGAHPIELTPVSPPVDRDALPFVFDISMGVRRDAVALAAELDGFIARRRVDIDAILDAYGVPRLEHD